MMMEFSAKSGGSVDVRALRRMAKPDEILIGHPSGTELPYGLDAATLAQWLNDGTAAIPARPYLLQGIRSEMSAIRKAMKLYLEEKRDNPNATPVKVAVMAVGAVQEFVRGDYYKTTIPNAPGTIRGKGGKDTPLIDTGALVDSVTYVVGKTEPSKTVTQDEIGAAA